MRGRHFILPALVVVLGFGLGACGSSPTTPTTFSQQSADDVAVLAAATLTGSSGGLLLELEAGSGSVPSTAALRLRPGEPAPYASATSETTFSVGSVEYTVSRTFYDADGNTLSGYGPEATHLRITCRAQGSVSAPQREASIARFGVHDVTGIEAGRDTLQFDGAGNDTIQCHFTSFDGMRERYFYALGARSLDAVRLLKDRDVNPYPLSGKARWAWEADRLRSNERTDVETHFSALVEVTFNGTANPEIVVNGSYHYHVNLDTGAVTRA